MMIYPDHIKTEHREKFRQLVEVAKTMNTKAIIIIPDDTTVLIQLDQEEVTLADWEQIAAYNFNNYILRAELIPITEYVEGERYYV